MCLNDRDTKETVMLLKLIPCFEINIEQYRSAEGAARLYPWCSTEGPSLAASVHVLGEPKVHHLDVALLV